LSVFLYADKNTAIHRLDPRVKLALMFWAFLAAVISTDAASLGAVCGIILVGFILSQTLSSIAKTGWMLLLVGGMTFLLWYFSYQAVPEGPGRESVALVRTLRFTAMLLAGILFLSVTALHDFANALMLLKLPYPAAFAVSLSFKLVSTFMNTAFIIVEAQGVRGSDAARGSIIKRMKAYAPLMVPLILNGIKKAETLHLALESKGFSPDNKPDIRGRYALTRADKITLISAAAAALIMVLYRIFVH
jgi:energy-coupling factor transport system permease protein